MTGRAARLAHCGRLVEQREQVLRAELRQDYRVSDQYAGGYTPRYQRALHPYPALAADVHAQHRRLNVLVSAQETDAPAVLLAYPARGGELASHRVWRLHDARVVR